MIHHDLLAAFGVFEFQDENTLLTNGVASALFSTMPISGSLFLIIPLKPNGEFT